MRAIPCALLIVCLLAGPLLPAAQAADAMWVWERATESIIEGPDRDTELQNLIDFCEENFIDQIYMAAQKVNPNNPNAQQPSMLIPANYPRWEQVLTALHNAGIRVESLSGKGDWLMPTGNWTKSPLNFPLKEDRGYGLGILDDILTYQEAHAGNPVQQFDGIHLDIEIQTLVPDDPDPDDDFFELYDDPDHPGEKIDELKRINFFLEFIDQVTTARAAFSYDETTLPFNWDISMNYDLGPSPKAPGHASRVIEYPDANSGVNVTKPAWQHIFDRLEQITFLTYSDRIRPIAAQMKVELAYVDSLVAPPLIRFSLEFQDRFRNNDLASVGVGNEDRQAYINLRQNASTLMIGRGYFIGWAMHTYDNINPANGDYQTWVADNPPITYPPQPVLFEPLGSAIILPTRPSEPIMDPIYVRLKLQAHPDFVHIPGAFGSRSMMSILPTGYGYASEADIEKINDISPDEPNRWYDGAAPIGWFYYHLSSMRWWRSSDGPDTEVNELVMHGLTWPNPVTVDNPALGVERDIVLQEGQLYRLQLIYNGPTDGGILEFANMPLCGTAPLDNSPTNPLEVTIVLGQLANLGSGSLEHSNTSVTIVDNDGDGLLDVEEMLMGTDSCNPSSQPSAQVVGRQIFYNNSAFDGNDPSANANDDQAIALDKLALMPDDTARFVHYTSYSRGINGIMVDIQNLPEAAILNNEADLVFRMGNDNDPSGWVDAPAPESITIRPGPGGGNFARVTIIWSDAQAVKQQWLQVTVRATDQTGLGTDDVFYFGNAIGDSGDSEFDAQVGIADELNARFNPHNFTDPAPIDDFVDFNRDARVTIDDELTVRFNPTNFITALKLITVPPVSGQQMVLADAPVDSVEQRLIQISSSRLINRGAALNTTAATEASSSRPFVLQASPAEPENDPLPILASVWQDYSDSRRSRSVIEARSHSDRTGSR